jgi:acyl dehydratase
VTAVGVDNDFAQIKPGYELPELVLPPISRTTLALFAGGSGDHNPVHLDVDFARSAGMPDVFAHGMLTMAYLGRLVTGWVEQQRIRSLSARFVSITPVGAAPRCAGSVTSVYERDGRRYADIALTATISEDTVTVTGTATVDISDVID